MRDSQPKRGVWRANMHVKRACNASYEGFPEETRQGSGGGFGLGRSEGSLPAPQVHEHRRYAEG